MFNLQQLLTTEHYLNPLLSPGFQQSNNVSVYSPAVTSSGDVYHIAAYCLLCQHFNWFMPKIFLSYDVDKTKVHAERAKTFLNTLFGDSLDIHLLSTSTSTYRYNTRNKLALDATRVSPAISPASELIINQKMLTSLINSAIMIYGFGRVNKILRHGFKNRKILKGQAKPISGWISNKVKAVKNAVGNFPFVIIHNRFSKDANDNQNLDHSTLIKVINSLRQNGVEVIIVNVSSDYIPAIQTVHTINAFEYITNLNPIYCKFQHILLLSALADLPSCRGVIGGTSGTLDVLGFMGINILDIHNFSNKSGTFAPHQDFRLLLQSVFMSVCSASLTENTILFWLLFRNFLFNYGTIPLGLTSNHDSKKEREIFNVAYRPNATTNPVNHYYHFQKQVLESKAALGQQAIPVIDSYFNGKRQIRSEEQSSFNDIIANFNASRP